MSETQTVTLERTLPHAPQKVWRALTESDLIAEWLMQNDFQPTPGQPFTLRMPAMPNWDGIIDCQVVTVEPYTHLAYTWTSMGVETVVTFTLTEQPEGTHLKLEQSGFPIENKAAYQGATYGWTSFLTKMDTVLTNLA